MPKTTPVPGEMSDIDVGFVSLVRKGANKQKIQIYKSEDESAEQMEVSPKELNRFFTILQKFFTGKDHAEPEPDAVAIGKAVKAEKAPSFSGRIAAKDLMSNMYQINDALAATFRDILGAEDMKDKKAAMGQAVDEYAAYIKGHLKAIPISKSAVFCGLSKGEENTMNEEALKKLVADAMTPLNERIAALEEKTKPTAKENETPVKKEDAGADVSREVTAEAIKSALESALKPVCERLDVLENARGISKGEVPDDKQQIGKSADDPFDGYFI